MPRPLWVATVPRALALVVVGSMAGWLAFFTLQQDFAAYYTAGAAAARGLDPYLNHLVRPDGPWDGLAIFEHSRFLYPPLMATLFRPFAALPYGLAKALFSAVCVGALFTAHAMVERGRATNQAWAMPLLWAVWPPVFLTLERGQIDLLLLACLAAAWHWRKRALLAGALVALAVMGKPLLLGMIPVLVGARRYRWAAATAGALLVFLGLNVVVAGPALTEKYLFEVLPRAASYGEGGPAALLLDQGDVAIPGAIDDLHRGIGRIDGRGATYPQEIGNFHRNASLSRALAGAAAPSLGDGLLVLLIFSLIFLVIWMVPLHRRLPGLPDDPAWYWGGMLVALLAAPVSWAMGLVWVLPLFRLVPEARGRRSMWLMAATWAACLSGPVLAFGWIATGIVAIAAAVGQTQLQLHPVEPPGADKNKDLA